MKAKLLTLAAATLVVGGLSSCNKTATNGITGSEGDGNVKITVSFSSPTTKDVSDDVLRPTNSATDISSLLLILVNSNTNQVTYTKDISSEYAGNNHVTYMNNIPAASYEVYAIANYTDAETTAYQYGYGGLPGTAYSVPATNSAFESGVFNIATATVPNGRLENTDNVYTAAPNYFTGVSSEFTVAVDQTSNVSVSLSRPVNLVRAKISLGDANLESDGITPMVDFADADAAMILRRVNSTYDFVSGEYNYSGSAIGQSQAYSGGAYTYTQDMTIPSGYTGSTNYFENWYTDGYLWYKDMLVFPPLEGADTSSDDYADMYNVVLQGVVVSDNYSGADKEDIVSWTKNVDLSEVTNGDNVYNGNQIVVLNLKLTSTGFTGPVPEVGNFGTVEITVTLEDWADVIETDIEI